MAFYRRRLPHLYQEDRPVFITWRLHDSLPPNRVFLPETVSDGQAFAIMDRLLEETRMGSFYLRQPPNANMVVDSIYHHAEILKRFDLHAYVVMPNHVHLLVTPLVALPKLTKTLKGFTAKQANEILHLKGTPFWQEESYDHLVRDQSECDRIKGYIEFNPVRAGLVTEPHEHPRSSAGATRRSPADQAVRPTTI